MEYLHYIISTLIFVRDTWTLEDSMLNFWKFSDKHFYQLKK